MRPEDEQATERFDYVVVGAGSAGCVLAARLSEDPGTSVLLIEAGPEDRHPYVHIPAAFSRLFDGPLDWGYRTVPQPALGGRRVFWPRGRVLGGSSSLNAMMWIPGFAADFDAWAERAGPSWGAASLLPYLERVAHFEPGGSDDGRADSGDVRAGGDQAGGNEGGDEAAAGGPLPVTPLVEVNPLTRLFLQTAANRGLRCAPGGAATDPQAALAGHPIATGSAGGVAETVVNQHRGRRVSSADAYLRPALGRPNLVVRTGARCVGIRFEGRRAVAVLHRSGRHQQLTAVRREVILCAGAIGSPQLLCCSGVGPGEELSRLAIDVVADRPSVGRGLEDHLASGIAWRTRRRVSVARAERPGALLRYLVRRTGPLTSPVAEAYGFVRSEPDLDLPDLELLFLPVAFLDEGLAPPRHGVSLAAVLLQPESRGIVALASPDPAVAPRIDPAYLSDPAGRDRDRMLAGLRRCQQLLAAEPLAGELAELLAPAGATEESLAERALVELSQTLYHPTGTCAIGIDPGAVLDPHCRVRGVEALRVVDASAIPRIGRGHTHAATVLLAERAAELIRTAEG